MSTSTIEFTDSVDADFSHLVESFASQEKLPSTDWLIRLNADRPRRDMLCLSPTARIVKRLSDIVIASTLILLLWPVILLVIIAVRMTSKGHALYGQTRVGLNLRQPDNDRRQGFGHPPAGSDDRRETRPDRRGKATYGREYTLYKIRTMYSDAEKSGPQFAQDQDPRITPIGNWLRKVRIDELPQLWNVLKGEMSMVGPRPERPEFIKDLSVQIPNYLDRLGLKPGLTGVSQVVNGYDNKLEDFRRKVAYDLLYLQNCCLANDLLILMRTVKVVVTGFGAK